MTSKCGLDHNSPASRQPEATWWQPVEVCHLPWPVVFFSQSRQMAPPTGGNVGSLFYWGFVLDRLYILNVTWQLLMWIGDSLVQTKGLTVLVYISGAWPWCPPAPQWDAVSPHWSAQMLSQLIYHYSLPQRHSSAHALGCSYPDPCTRLWTADWTGSLSPGSNPKSPRKHFILFFFYSAIKKMKKPIIKF